MIPTMPYIYAFARTKMVEDPEHNLIWRRVSQIAYEEMSEDLRALSMAKHWGEHGSFLGLDK